MSNNTMIILMGLPGSGKSTMVKSFPHHTRICQDVIGNRNDCINVSKLLLEQGKNVVIDRTNISRQQRKYFIDVAKTFDYKVYCIFLDIPAIECIERVKNRKDHETIKDLTDEKIINIVSKFNKELELPDYDEGFEEIIHINDSSKCRTVSNFFKLSGQSPTN